MGKFACRCGNIISDSTYPCPLVGTLRWQTETEVIFQENERDTKDFLNALENGKGKEWVQKYFGKVYPSDLNVSEITDDINGKNENKHGRCVTRCPECERLYVQKEFFSDEWICYEKVE